MNLNLVTKIQKGNSYHNSYHNWDPQAAVQSASPRPVG